MSAAQETCGEKWWEKKSYEGRGSVQGEICQKVFGDSPDDLGQVGLGDS